MVSNNPHVIPAKNILYFWLLINADYPALKSASVNIPEKKKVLFGQKYGMADSVICSLDKQLQLIVVAAELIAAITVAV